jgi:hypothetical protein
MNSTRERQPQRYPSSFDKDKAVPQHAYGSAGWGGARICNSYSFTTSALDGSEWSASRPGRALPPGKGPRYILHRRLGGPQSRSGHRGYRKNLLPLRGSNLDRPVRSQDTILTVLHGSKNEVKIEHGQPAP